MAVGCGGGSEAKGRITIGGFNFTESSILAELYGGALRADGYDVVLRPDMGSREVVAPALARGDIDLYIGYAASELEFTSPGSGEHPAAADETVRRLREALSNQGVTALDPAPAVNTNAFAVSTATAEKYGLRKLSDLAPVAAGLVLGGPPECPTRAFCRAGLERVYGLRFKEFRTLDAGGILSMDALRSGEADVILVFSSDGSILGGDIVLLEDDKGLQPADNVVPMIRSGRATGDVRRILDRVSAALQTDDLIRFNKRVEDEDRAALTEGWLRDHGLIGTRSTP